MKIYFLESINLLTPGAESACVRYVTHRKF